MPTLPEESPLEPGAMPPWARDPSCPAVERYLLGPELGRGGMGRVHAAWDPVLKRVVALKLLHGNDPDLNLRLLREARTQAKVDHSGVCRVHDLGQADGRPYIAMRLVQGRSLADLGPELDFRAMATLMAEVAGAVQAAHRAGLIHRDLKPANILVERRRDGSLRPSVVDFGLARDLTLTDQTLSWAVTGTPAFMSPEQTQGEALGPATDIYSLGATLYALISGQPPYEGSTLGGLITNQNESGVRAVRRLNPAVPRDLETITLKCLEREPARRYASAGDLEADLRRFLAGKPVLARPVGAFGRLWRWARRRPALAATATTGILASLLLMDWNSHIRATSSLREQAAQRFGMEIRDAEHLLRIERMMPVHDIRPAEGRLRARMEGIRRDMARLGAASQGPGYYALGRGNLALKQYQQAQQELETAWNSGFQAPEVAYGIGLALLKQYETDTFQHLHHPDLENQLRKWRAQRLPQAHLWMSRAAGAQVDHPEYGAGLAAFAEGRNKEALAHLDRALEQAPWLYEAWVSKAILAWSPETSREFHGNSRELDAILVESQDYLQGAERLAPSDEGILIQHAWAMLSSGISNSARNDRKAAPFLEAKRLLAEAQKIRPDSQTIQLGLLNAELQLGYLELSSGGDPGPRLIRLARSMDHLPSRTTGEPDTAQFSISVDLLVLWTLVAEADLRFGRNPAEPFREAERWEAQTPRGVHKPLLWLFKAKALEDHHQDPSSLLLRCVYELEQLAYTPQAPKNFSQVTLGRTLFELGRWQWSTQRAGRANLERAVATLEACRREDPQFAHIYYHLPRAHALLARIALATGRDPQPHVRAALETGRQGRAINPRNVLLPFTEADAHLAEGQVRAAQGLDPEPAWAAGHEALDAAQRINPRDYRLYALRAELELAAAGASKDPRPLLQAAMTTCRKGRALKPNEPQFRDLQARIEREAARTREW